MFDRNLKLWEAEAARAGNPLLSEWHRLAVDSERISDLFMTDRRQWYLEIRVGMKNETSELLMRKKLARQYAWAIPCDAALSAIAAHSPLIEIGAGTGYWASLLAKIGADVLAFDIAPANAVWHKVERGDHQVISEHPGRTLFLCWPPHDEPMAYHCLAAYRGKTLAFVGDGDGGCTACSNFFYELAAKFEHVQNVDIPQWDGIHDYLAIYKRK